ncbi:hypothetical protein H7X87_03330 [Acetobacteraceae bacterium]|nr:hypothetical protein [Candidatus Parcubacteria bacterium]
MKSLYFYVRMLLAFSLLTPAFVMAQVGAGVNAGASATVNTTNTAQVRTTAGASTTVSTAVMARAKAKAGQEIERRTKALSDLKARVAGMNKVTGEFKTNLNTNIDTQIQALGALKTKIDADTEGEVLRADVVSVTQSYRIYALIIPQARIAAAADREAKIINMMATLGAKLQARIEAAQTAGADITVISAVLVDMGAKLQSAQVHAQAAVNGSATLTPDNGDAAKMASNAAALKTAQAEIKAAHQDVLAARKNVDTIVKGLGTISAGASASGTVQTQ